MNQPIPNWLQWLALLATFAGMILALWAALSATGARRQAQLAREAAVRLGRIAQVHDLLEA